MTTRRDTAVAAPPGLRTKLGFWLIVGMFSTAFAEVLSGSFPLPFLRPAGPLVVLPVYLLHSLLALWAVYRFGRPRFGTLYFLGVLFGFYEFYLTKVLWAPPWGAGLVVGGIDVVTLVVLGFFWHPLLAFMVPLAVSEAAGARSSDVVATLPFGLARPGRALAGVVLVLAAVLHGALAGGPLVAAASVASTVGALLLAVWWWRRDPRRRRWTLRELAPAGWEVVALGGATLVMYVTFGFRVHLERVPGLGTQALTWVLYLLVGWLFLRVARRSRHAPAPRWDGPPGWWPLRHPGRVLLAYGGLVVAASLTGARDLAALGVFLVAGTGGVVLLARGLRRAFGAPPAPHPG